VAEGLINTILPTIQYHMIDIWFFAAFCLGVLALCAVLRIIFPGPSPDDRYVAMNAAITIVAGSALGLGISWGNLFLLNVFIVLIALSYAATIVLARTREGRRA
jgi:multisubunit Na+/H+ antiporter MnhF subunit